MASGVNSSGIDSEKCPFCSSSMIHLCSCCNMRYSCFTCNTEYHYCMDERRFIAFYINDDDVYLCEFCQESCEEYVKK